MFGHQLLVETHKTKESFEKVYEKKNLGNFGRLVKFHMNAAKLPRHKIYSFESFFFGAKNKAKVRVKAHMPTVSRSRVVTHSASESVNLTGHFPAAPSHIEMCLNKETHFHKYCGSTSAAICPDGREKGRNVLRDGRLVCSPAVMIYSWSEMYYRGAALSCCLMQHRCSKSLVCDAQPTQPHTPLTPLQMETASLDRDLG